MTIRYRIAVVGSGPAGLSAAARAAELGVSHILLEAEKHLSNTIYRYQRGKHVMAEPVTLPLRSPLTFEAGKREEVLQQWSDGVDQLEVNLRKGATVTGIGGESGAFEITLADGEIVEAERVVLSIGLQGNLRKLGIPGEDADFVHYQLDDPDEIVGEDVCVIGAGDAAIENALALAEANRVTIINRRDGFDRAKDANRDDITAAIDSDRIRGLYNTQIKELDQTGDKPAAIFDSDDGTVRVEVDRIIARLGASPPRRFVESCGVTFPSDDPASVPQVTPQYESNVEGLHIIGALAGYPLIKQAMNQGYEVVEYIEGNDVEPADTPILREKFAPVAAWSKDVDAAIEEIREKVPVLAPLTPLQLREFLLDSTVHAPKRGATVFERNDYTNSFYVIVSGGVSVVSPADGARIPLGVGEFFGEMGLISGRRRSATVHAEDGCVLIESPRRTMVKLMHSLTDVRRVIDQVFLHRAIQSQLAPDVPKDGLDELVESAEFRTYRKDDVLFSEGEHGDTLHLIRRGSVMISRKIGGRDVVLAYVPAGQYIGEMSLISDLPRSATAEAAVGVETIALPRDAFRRLMDAYPAVRRRVEAVYKERLRSNTQSGQEDNEQHNILSFLMEQGVGEATDVLLIDESLCVRCDQCETACAATHGNVSRLDREAGPTFAEVHVPTSCRHCEHPHCMKDCPPDAIHRAPSGEVHITDACIGCGNCERNCPYDVIQMGVESKPAGLFSWMMFGLGEEPGHASKSAKPDQQKKAAKCDMCKDLSGGPRCVKACPTGAAQRASPEKFMQVYQGGTSNR